MKLVAESSRKKENAVSGDIFATTVTISYYFQRILLYFTILNTILNAGIFQLQFTFKLMNKMCFLKKFEELCCWRGINESITFIAID